MTQRRIDTDIHDPGRNTTGEPTEAQAFLGITFICLMSVVVTMNYVNHGPVIGLISAEFDLAAGAAGTLSTAVAFGSLLTMLPGGLLSDRFGPRRIVTIGFFLVAFTNLTAGLWSPTFSALLAWRVLNGVGQGIAFAAGAAYARAIFVRHGVHLAQGLYGASALLGSGAALVVMPPLVGPNQDWRQAFVLSGIGVLAAWAAWTFIAPAGPGPRPGQPMTLKPVLGQRNVPLFAMCHMAGFGLALVISTWSTAYLMQAFGLPIEQAGLIGSLLLVTGIASRTGGGALLEHGVRPLLLIRGALCLAAGGLVLMALPLGVLGVAIGGLLVTGVGIGLPYAPVYNGAAASAAESPAAAQSVVGLGAQIFTIVSAPLVGALMDLSGSFAVAFLVLAGFVLLVLGGTLGLQPFALAPTERSTVLAK